MRQEKLIAKLSFSPARRDHDTVYEHLLSDSALHLSFASVRAAGRVAGAETADGPKGLEAA